MRPTRSRKPVLALLAVLVAASVPACRTPFTSHPSDYGEVVDKRRLRTVKTFEFDRHASAPEEGGLSEDAGPAPPPTPEELRARFEGLASLDLTLQQARVSALEHNLDLRASLVDPSIANAQLTEEEAAFDALLFADYQLIDNDTPTASQLTDSQQRFQSLDLGVRIPLRTGGQAEVRFPFTRNRTNNQFTTLNPSVTSDLEFSLSQPLLRNAGRRATTHGIRVASYNRQISETQTTLAVINELTSVDRAYWDLYRARSTLDVRQQQYELALAQLERAERQARVGRVAEIEVIRAQSGVADRLEDIIVAENDVLTRQRELKRLVNTPGLDVDTETIVVPATEPDPARYDLDAEALAEAAERNRMELLELELRLLADAADIRLRKNQLLPELSVDLLYRINGLGGNLGDALDQLADNNFEDFSIGVNAEFPVGNRAARSRFRQALFTRLQRLATRESRRQTIRQEVHDAIDELDSTWQRIIASRQSVVLNVRTLEAEQRRFEVGRSTSDDVLEATADLADARLAEVNAVVDYELAQVELARAAGMLTGAARVRWDPPAPAEARESWHSSRAGSGRRGEG